MREHLAQASVRRGCAVRVWGIHGCSWNTSCTYGMSFQTCFTVYIAPFLLGKFAFVGKKKKNNFLNNHSLMNHNRAGTVSLFGVFGSVSRNSTNMLPRTGLYYC